MTFPVMLLHLIAVSIIVPCLVAVGLSQKVHDWTPNA